MDYKLTLVKMQTCWWQFQKSTVCCLMMFCIRIRQYTWDQILSEHDSRSNPFNKFIFNDTITSFLWPCNEFTCIDNLEWIIKILQMLSWCYYCYHFHFSFKYSFLTANSALLAAHYFAHWQKRQARNYLARRMLFIFDYSLILCILLCYANCSG